MEHARFATPDDRPALALLAAEAREESRAKRGGNLLVNRELAALAELDLLDAANATSPASDAHGATKVVVVGTIDEVVVGYARLRIETLRTDETIAMIDELYVDPEARGVGVGEAIMDLLVEHARRHDCIGIDAVALPGDRQTKNFFETFGLTARAIVVHRAL
jgi:ribosomal protein S18 acetylase RimI-like enzyme